MVKTALITGATRGIGKALAEKFAAEGFQLALCARNVEAHQAWAKQLGSHTLLLACDVSNTANIKAFAAKVLQDFGCPDVLINNAGIFLPGQVHDEPEGTLEKLMAVNLYSAYHLCREIVPCMKERRRGHIFNISSVAGLRAYPNGGSYSITKFAMQGLSRALREELKPYNIRVTNVVPGATYTDSWSGTDLPHSRFMTAEDIARCVWDAYSLSPNTVVEEIVLRPQLGDI
ncbi:MAG: SDR family oxidoreductase [Chitinophagales bacterium]|nr:SDR family oxidoreductase [Chitinophagales bacterium]MDW8417903.1 SDR family oxidoreductase [Chitinophagales bacterium]